MNRLSLLSILVIACCIVTAGWLLRNGLRSPDTPQNFSVADILQNNGDGNFDRVTEPRDFSFPEDYGPHDSYRTEWWYFTGNLEDEKGREFGYQLTFFRYSPTSAAVPTGSAWRTRQIYMAHLAVSDVRDGRLHAFERFSRAAAGLAGAKSDSLHVWLDNWRAESELASAFPLRLHAEEKNIVIDLLLKQGKPIVLHGENGLSIKNSGPGNASYYYSFTRMPTTGTILINGNRFRTSGLSWMDREWSTSALSPDQLGWDWFALQLSDGNELMLYQFRRKDGKTDPFSYGVLVTTEGTTQSLKYDMVDIDIKSYWQSPRDATRYPSQWQIRIPAHDIKLDVRPAIADQELDLSFRYWEGAVRVRGTKDKQNVSGRGYVELTGYADAQSVDQITPNQ
jgi:predicted secreted hydrolase